MSATTAAAQRGRAATIRRAEEKSQVAKHGITDSTPGGAGDHDPHKASGTGGDRSASARRPAGGLKQHHRTTFKADRRLNAGAARAIHGNGIPHPPGLQLPDIAKHFPLTASPPASPDTIMKLRKSLMLSAREEQQEAQASATGVSYISEPAKHARVPHGPMVTNSDEHSGNVLWNAELFNEHRPAGRHDVLKLRSSLQEELRALQEAAESQEIDSLQFADLAMEIYSNAFREVTRQVSTQCLDRGRLMADVWRSQQELIGRVVANLQMEKELSDSTAATLKQSTKELEQTTMEMQNALIQKRAECNDLAFRLQAMERAALKNI